MDPFTAFLIFAALVVLDTLAAQAFWPAYFRIGIPVFHARRPLAPAQPGPADGISNQPPAAPGLADSQPAASSPLDAEDPPGAPEAAPLPPGKALAHALEQRFHSQPEHPSLHFRALPGTRPDRFDLAFRERLFENRAGFKYLPVMHSLARLRPAWVRTGSAPTPPTGLDLVSVTGYLNLYVLFTLGYLVYRSAADRSFVPVSILVLFVLVLSYFGQANLDLRVLEEISSPQPPVDDEGL